MTRFQKLAAATVLTTILLVTLGVIVRATASGTACPTWPGCFEGQFLPSPSDGYQVWLEWVHRTVAVIIGFEVIGLGLLAVLDLRSRRTLLAATVVARGRHSSPPARVELAAELLDEALLVLAHVRIALRQEDLTVAWLHAEELDLGLLAAS